MGFVNCSIYLAFIGLFSTVSSLVPRSWFHPDRFPYRLYSWEKNGDVYEKISIRSWKDRVPDMSKILPWVPMKTISSRPDYAKAVRMVQETCVSEFVHYVLSFLSVACIFIWKRWGWLVTVLTILIGHLPFILIQRYNRPRLIKIREMLKKRKGTSV